MPLWLRRATRERLGYLLEAVAREALNQGISVAGSKLKQKIKGRILRGAPKDPFLTRRLLRGGDIEHISKKAKTKQKRKPVDSVQSRDATLPRRGLAGVTGRRIVVYHEADRAGPHLEAYIEVDGVAHNVGVKRLTPAMVKQLDIRRRSGWLTKATQQRMLDFWASEFELGKSRWLGQSTDHKPHEARMEWESRESGVVGYGAGELRQVLADDEVAISTLGKAVEWRDPKIDKHHDAFAFVVMDERKGKRSRPIIGIGLKKHPAPPPFDKLKLKFKNDIGKFLAAVGDGAHLSVKEDGASTKFVITSKGAVFWAPRDSKMSGERINYTWRLRDWQTVSSKTRIEGKGELLFFRGKRQLKAAEIGGLLNSDGPLPKDVRTELVVYSVDKLGRKATRDVPHAEMLGHIEDVASKHSDWRPATPIEADPKVIARICKQQEGVVGVKANGSIAGAGYKLKLRNLTHDWMVESVELRPGPKGRGDIAGVVWFRSLESGRRFKLGPSALGNRSRQIAMMSLGHRAEGRVFKVASQNGHEGRAAKMLEEHPDKGMAE